MKIIVFKMEYIYLKPIDIYFYVKIKGHYDIKQ